jgi:hypothetical protein
MSAIAGWRIQVRPQYCEPDLTNSIFINVRIADREAAIAAVRSRSEAEPGERIYAVRPLASDEVGEPLGRVIQLTDDLRRRRARPLAHKLG